MKTLFLDIDGVLNSDQFIKANTGKWDYGWELEYPHTQMDPLAVKVLELICKQSEAKIVISSSWRLLHTMEEIEKCLRHHGFTGEIIGKTPRLAWREDRSDRFRGNEIQAWLDENEVEKFVILDDASDMEHLTSYLVQTDFETGLLEKHIPLVLHHLIG